jgi:hypothetical protein
MLEPPGHIATKSGVIHNRAGLYRVQLLRQLVDEIDI